MDFVNTLYRHDICTVYIIYIYTCVCVFHIVTCIYVYVRRTYLGAEDKRKNGTT